jgi:hypothetical protein
MSVRCIMSVKTSQPEIVPFRTATPVARWATGIELLLVYAGILLYIWRWQFSYPRAWIPLLAVVLASHFVHHERLHDLGFTWRSLRASASVILPLASTVYVVLILYGFVSRRLTLTMLNKRALIMFVTYGLWCLFQQYLAQSYIHNRLMCLIRSRHLSSLLVGLMFGAAHIPNPILVVATSLGGFVLAEVYARHRNIWPLALAQAVGGFLIAALSPPALIHNMRVGPGYFFYGLH